MNIILLTKYFPYNRADAPGETFLDSEIHVLSGLADDIYVIASEAGPGSVPSIELPPNVHHIPAGSGSVRNAKIRAAMKGAVSKAPVCLKEDIKGRPLKQKVFARYFHERAKKIADDAEVFLSRMDIKGETLIYSYWLYYHAEAALMIKERLFENAKVFSRAHRYDLYENENRMGYIPLRGYLLDNLDMVFPCSDSGSEYLRGRYGHDEKISTVYLGTKDRGEEEYRKGDERLVVSCSRIVPVKRVMRIAETIARMGGSVRWIHFGGGDGLKEIEDCFRKSTKGARAEFPGNTPNEKILEFYREASIDAFINVSESEGLPISIMEALSFGIPVIATDVGGVSEVVRNGETGFLLDKSFENSDLEELIERILKMPENEYFGLRKACRRVWEENFMYERSTKRMIGEAKLGHKKESSDV